MVRLTLIQGDCLKVLPTLPSESVDLVIADFPYNISNYGNSLTKVGNKIVRADFGEWDKFAVYPEKLVERAIKAGCPKDGTVLDPFAGSGTTGLVAIKERVNCIMIEIKPEYCEMIERRLNLKGLQKLGTIDFKKEVYVKKS